MNPKFKQWLTEQKYSFYTRRHNPLNTSWCVRAKGIKYNKIYPFSYSWKHLMSKTKV